MDKVYKQSRKEFCDVWFQRVLDIFKKHYKCMDWFDLLNLSAHPCVTWNIVKQHPNINWNYAALSRNPNITLDIVQQHPEIPWCYTSLSDNPNITWDVIQQHPEMPWCYTWLSENPNITWDIVQQHPEIPWNYIWLSNNPNITLDIVQQHPDKGWDYQAVHDNILNINRELYQCCPENSWKYNGWLSVDELKAWENTFIRQKMQDHFRTSALKEELMQTLFHPKNIHKFADWGFDE